MSGTKTLTFGNYTAVDAPNTPEDAASGRRACVRRGGIHGTPVASCRTFGGACETAAAYARLAANPEQDICPICGRQQRIEPHGDGCAAPAMGAYDVTRAR